MRIATHVAAGAVLLVALLSGCTSPSGPTNTGATASPSSEASVASPSAQPSAEPSAALELSDLRTDPCLALSQDDLDRLGGGFATPPDGEDDTSCLWLSQPSILFIAHPTVDQTADQDNRDLMTETTVDGRPALVGVLIKNRGCMLYVRHGKDTSIEVHEIWDGEEPSGPTCGQAAEFAGAILDNLEQH
jgi:hypothetical protein